MAQESDAERRLVQEGHRGDHYIPRQPSIESDDMLSGWLPQQGATQKQRDVQSRRSSHGNGGERYGWFWQESLELASTRRDNWSVRYLFSATKSSGQVEVEGVVRGTATHALA